MIKYGKKKSKVKIKRLKQAYLLELWSEAVKSRDRHRCIYCGEKNNLESHHIFTRRHASVKYDIRNGITLCKNCHLRAHNDYMMVNWIKNCLGENLWMELEEKSYETKKWTEEEKRELINGFKAIIKENNFAAKGDIK